MPGILNVFGKWCCRRDLNSRPLPYQGSALPLSYGSICGAFPLVLNQPVGQVRKNRLLDPGGDAVRNAVAFATVGRGAQASIFAFFGKFCFGPVDGMANLQGRAEKWHETRAWSPLGGVVRPVESFAGHGSLPGNLLVERHQGCPCPLILLDAGKREGPNR